jgi:phosphoesterase RecJ-like protein
VEIAFVLKQPTEAPLFRLSMRSAIDFDVSAVCAAFGGGGHVRAAGATITDAADMEEAVERVLEEINRRFPT